MWWDIAPVGTISFRGENIKKAVEMAITNETNVADFYCRIMFPRVGLPESMAISRILEHKLFAENIVLHQWRSI
jgi:hypothetical protein